MNFKKQLREGLLTNNPVVGQLLGMCSTMAITTTLFNGLGMGLSVTLILICSNVVISMLRKVIPDKIRIAAYIVVIAGFVTIIDLLLQAYLPALSIGINSLLLGLFAGVYVNNGISLLAYFAGIVPHGIFELPALILALSSGIYLCRKVTDYVRHNEKGVMGPLMKDLLRLFVMHIIPLLMAAAVIEAYVTPQLLKLFL